jgi:hypothetical protein
MPADPQKSSRLGQRLAGGALVLVCGPIFLFVGGNLVWLMLQGRALGVGETGPGALAYMICFAGLTGLLAAYGVRMILRSLAN